MTGKKTVNKKNKDQIINIVLISVMVIGVLIVAYPTISDWWNSFHQTRAIASYTEKVAAMDTVDTERMLKEAEEYNAGLVDKEGRFAPSDEELEEYKGILDVTGTGIMGYVEIPKLHISLPVYHGSEDTVLQIAVGHLEGTSFPVGGTGTHAVLTGHRGLPSARLFTDIDQLTDGDHFMVHVLNRTVTYEVMEDLAIDPEKDYCTLITCTPYGINSHRLLVRGRRVDNDVEIMDVAADAQQVQPGLTALGIAIPILTLALIYILIMTSRRAARKKSRQKQGKENTL